VKIKFIYVLIMIFPLIFKLLFEKNLYLCADARLRPDANIFILFISCLLNKKKSIRSLFDLCSS
ncbi:TPA: hypothetical protein ACPTWG_005367, partial [Klebsiella pneumoniae]